MPTGSSATSRAAAACAKPVIPKPSAACSTWGVPFPARGGGRLERQRHTRATLERAANVRTLRDGAQLKWKDVAERAGVAMSAASYLYNWLENEIEPGSGMRRAIIATLQFGRTTGQRALPPEHRGLRPRRGPSALDAPEFPTRNAVDERGQRPQERDRTGRRTRPTSCGSLAARIGSGLMSLPTRFVGPTSPSWSPPATTSPMSRPRSATRTPRQRSPSTHRSCAAPTATNYGPRSKPYSALHRSRPNLPGRRFTVSIAARRSLPSTPSGLLKGRKRTDYDLPVRRPATTRPRV